MGALMFQGTGSDVGKSTLVAGLCRALSNRGLRVLPFKPQNMSNNAAVTADGGEIGRAQALQAFACRADPIVDMNPVLLKPQSEGESQLVVLGKVKGIARGRYFREGRGALMGTVLSSYGRLRDAADIVLVEGAGSPAEVNLRSGDIANMGFARAAGLPVILIGDIDRGGVIASLVGTHNVLEAEDRAAIQGFIINKFRGDPTLFADGYSFVEGQTGWSGFGIVPWLAASRFLPAEDAVQLERSPTPKPPHDRLVIACLRLPHIANFDDLDPLSAEPEVELVMVHPGQPVPAGAALVIIPGSKATLSDLAFVRSEGWDIDIRAHYRRGGPVMGLCGGYQMLGRTIDDPEGVEGKPGRAEGLGLLDVHTTLTSNKQLRQINGVMQPSGASFTGYEIHVGQTIGADMCRAPVMLEGGRPDGAASADGLIKGTYVHGMFASAEARAELLAELGGRSQGGDHLASVDAALDTIAGQLELCVDIDRMLALSKAAQ
jgi:adenosylcobyric acid synthase